MGGGLFDRLSEEMQAREERVGLTMSDVLALPAPERSLVSWIMRREQATLQDVVSQLGQDEGTARTTLGSLVEQGFLREIAIRGDVHYRARLAPKRGRDIPLNIWQALDDRVER